MSTVFCDAAVRVGTLALTSLFLLWGPTQPHIHSDYPLESPSVEQGNRALRFPARLAARFTGKRNIQLCAHP